MFDFLLFMMVLVIFLTGVQVGATVGGIPTMVRWLADRIDGWLHKDKQNAKKDD